MSKKLRFIFSCTLCMLSLLLPYSQKGYKFYFGFPFRFLETTKEIFVTNRIYFFNPAFTLTNALITIIPLILNILFYYLMINGIIKLIKFVKNKSYK